MPSIAITRSYEAIYILDPDLGEEKISATAGRYKQIVENSGGTVEKVDIWERRKLAYEIKGRTEGIYVVMQFSGEAKVETELRRIFQISEDQIRYMIVKAEEFDDANVRESGYNRHSEPAAQAPAAPAAVAAPAPEAVATQEASAPEAETAAPESETATTESSAGEAATEAAPEGDAASA